MTIKRKVSEEEEADSSESASFSESMDIAEEKVVNYFWETLYGKVISKWSDLPANLRTEILPSANIKNLTDQQVQELFKLRHSNNKEQFKTKLRNLRNH